jgi:hypothetical protein
LREAAFVAASLLATPEHGEGGCEAIHAQITPPTGRRLQALGCVLSERGWRVLENASAEKWRWNPERVQRRNRRKLNGGNRRTDQRHMGRMIAASSADQGHGAAVLGSIGIRVNPLMQRWRNSQRERPKKRAQNSGGNDRARRYRLSPSETKSHAREDCAFKRSSATQFRFHSNWM